VAQCPKAGDANDHLLARRQLGGIVCGGIVFNGTASIVMKLSEQIDDASGTWVRCIGPKPVPVGPKIGLTTPTSQIWAKVEFFIHRQIRRIRVRVGVRDSIVTVRVSF